jgi:hypothetical protein
VTKFINGEELQWLGSMIAIKVLPLLKRSGALLHRQVTISSDAFAVAPEAYINTNNS